MSQTLVHAPRRLVCEDGTVACPREPESRVPLERCLACVEEQQLVLEGAVVRYVRCLPTLEHDHYVEAID